MTILARTSKQKAPGEPGTDNAVSGGNTNGAANGAETGASKGAETGTEKGAETVTDSKTTGKAENGAVNEPAYDSADGSNGSADGSNGPSDDPSDGAASRPAGEDADAPADTPADDAAGLAAERDKYLRLAAEYDNFRKRSTKEMKTAYSDAKADTITRLLPVYDNLERALKTECSDEAFYKGVEMTMTQLSEILEGMGVTIIKAAGEPFDPNRHNAVATIENPDLGGKTVAEEYQKGFMLGERVLRFSTVVVAN